MSPAVPLGIIHIRVRGGPRMRPSDLAGLAVVARAIEVLPAFMVRLTTIVAVIVVFALTSDLAQAATKKSTRQPAGQIACTVAGCQRIPPNCHPEMGYNWDGIPTGFDIVVCGPPRGRRGY